MYINTQTLQYPVSEQDIRNQYSNTSFPTPFTPTEEYAYVFPAPKPEHSALTHYVVEGAPTLTHKGHWEQTWSVQELTPEAVLIAQANRLEYLKESIIRLVQERLDNFAKSRNYDNILSACTYATDPNPKFAQEGQYCVQKRGETWATLYSILQEVTEGLRPVPSGYSDIENLLPELSWPLL